MATVHCGDIGGRKRVRQDGNVHSAANEADERFRSLIAWHEIGRGYLESSAGTDQERREQGPEPAFVLVPECLLRRIGDDADRYH